MLSTKFTVFFAAIDGKKTATRLDSIYFVFVEGAVTEMLWDKIVEGGARHDVFLGVVGKFGGVGV